MVQKYSSYVLWTGLQQSNSAVCILGYQHLTVWRLAGFRDSRAKTTGSHVALHMCNLGAESGRELFKCSKDAASLLVCTRKNFLLGVLIFCEWRHKWKTFRPPWPTSPGPGRKPLDGSISLKFLLKTRLQSESFDTLDDLLGFRVKKSQSEIIKYLTN